MARVTESFDGGANWTQKFTTSSSTRSGRPGVAILAIGAIGLLYNNYAPAMGDPATGTLSQHLLTTTDHFATTRDVTLASVSNSTPTYSIPISATSSNSPESATHSTASSAPQTPMTVLMPRSQT